MDYITVGRLSKMIEDLGTVPEEVQMSEVKLVNIYSTSSNTDKAVGLTSYSNGIESFGYDTQKSYEEHLLDTCYSVLMAPRHRCHAVAQRNALRAATALLRDLLSPSSQGPWSEVSADRVCS